jgi:CBS domain containing-hemolysin-like protein
VLLQEFKKSKRHLAIVRNESHNVLGLITLEDIIEEIIGEIQDEFDDEQLYYREIDDFSAVFDAKTLLEDCRLKFEIPKTDIEENSENLTIGGLMMISLGRIPKNGQTIKIGENILLSTELADKKKIYRVRLELKQ